jgi:hypothetical protein
MPISFMTIDVAGATNTDAHGINASGQIVGDYTDGSGIQGFLLSGGSFTALNAPSFVMLHTTLATHINSSAQITGYMNLSPHQGFVYSNGTYGAIFAPGGGLTFLEGTNDVGQIVGYTYVDISRVPAHVTSFIYSNGSFTSFSDPQEILPGFIGPPLGTFCAGHQQRRPDRRLLQWPRRRPRLSLQRRNLHHARRSAGRPRHLRDRHQQRRADRGIFHRRQRRHPRIPL